MRASSITIPQFVQEIITHLHTHHFQAFVIGGCVRDSLLGEKPKDWDITTDATPKQIQAIFAKSYKLITLGERYGTIGIITNTAAGICVEITTFRLESSYTNSRHPSDVSYTTDLLQDLKRRDFTCNALAYNPYLPTLHHLDSSAPNSPLQDEVQKLDSSAYALYHRYMPYICDGICDYVGGLADIATRTLRCVGDANARFSEDALRILRALRFCAVLDFTLESSTRAALFANAKKLAAISAERKQEEWSKILCAKHITKAVLGFGAVWVEVFGEFAAPLKQLDSSPQMRTTLATLESINKNPHFYMDSIESIRTDSALSLRLSLWLYALDSTQEQAASSLKALRYKSRIISLCQTLLSHANLPSHQSLESTRILARDIGLESTFLLCAFLSLLHGKHYATPLAKHLSTIRTQKLCYNLATLALNGDDLTAIANSMGIVLQGREIGRLLRSLLDAVICSRVPNTKDALCARAKELIQASLN